MTSLDGRVVTASAPLLELHVGRAVFIVLRRAESSGMKKPTVPVTGSTSARPSALSAFPAVSGGGASSSLEEQALASHSHTQDTRSALRWFQSRHASPRTQWPEPQKTSNNQSLVRIFARCARALARDTREIRARYKRRRARERSHELFVFGGDRRGLNPRQLEPQSSALPTELRPP